MAGMVQPIDSFYPEIAEIWIEQMHTVELAEFTTLSLFRRLPYAPELAFRCMADERDMFQLCGFLLMSRLLMTGVEMNERAENEYLDQVAVGLHASNPSIRSAALTSLQKYRDLGSEQEQKALAILPS